MLTGLRFVAAFLVYLDHVHWLDLFPSQKAHDDFNFAVLNLGAVSVAFFFILTGFVLVWSTKPSDTATRFWRRRFFRVVPNHVVTYALCLALLLMTGGPIWLPAIVLGLFLLDNYTADMTFAFYAVNGVTWSLSLDWSFYLLFPVLFVLIRKIRPEHLWRWAIAVAALIILLPAISQPFLSNDPWFVPYGMSWPELWWISGSPVRLLEFGFGALLARIVMTGRWIRLPVWPSALGIVAAYIASLYVPRVWTFGAIFLLPMGGLIAAVAIREIKGHKSWLSSKPMVWLGEISYAFYLVHFTLLWALHGALSGKIAVAGTVYDPVRYNWFGVIVFIVAATVLSVLLSWLLYKFVERPMMRRFANKRRAVAPA